MSPKQNYWPRFIPEFKPFPQSHSDIQCKYLSLATHKSGKKTLILDMSILNLSIKKEKVKFEDWKIAVQYFERDAFMFKFDLKSDYFHLDIFPQQHTYLGFMWKGKFYCFTVLVFGISTGPYMLTKCLRPMVKYWRENSVKIVLYLNKLKKTTCYLLAFQKY
jgi:hypothetical protein